MVKTGGTNLMEVTVITGGGSGIGLEVAKSIIKGKVVITGRTEKKLMAAKLELTGLGVDAEIFPCDVSKRSDVIALRDFASSLGNVKTLIHAAGLSPHMGDPKKLIEVNALGTVYMDTEFMEVMETGGCIINVSSNSAYQIPNILISEKVYKLALTDEEKFVKRLIKKSSIIRDDYKRKGLAYAYSKNFVLWFSKYFALKCKEKNIRVLSVSPGLIKTPMGDKEKDEGAEMLKYGAISRMGEASEVAYLINSVSNSSCGYLTGVDILCDGGCTNLKRYAKMV